jgi:excisionase family DNA binding protein
MTTVHPEARGLTFKEAAALVPCDPRTISAAVRAGRIPTIQLGERKLIPRVAFEKYLEGGVEEGAA